MADADSRLMSVVARATGADVIAIDLVREGPRSRVWRCALSARERGPATVVVRQLADDSDLGLTDWATLAFLGATVAAAGLAPEVLGGSVEDRVVVLGDLGSGRSLDGLLAGDDLVAARDALLALADRYGLLHAATSGRQTEFDEACAGIPGSRPPGREAELTAWRAGLASARAWAEAAAIAAPAGFDLAVERVAAVMRDPGAFLALTHGDPAPSNTHVASDSGDVRLLDFEYGAYRHALYDMTAWEVLCPMPRGILDDMIARYRAASAPRTDAVFRAHWGAVVAYRALAILGWIPVETVREDAPWVGEWSRRDAVLAAMRRLGTAAARLDDLAPIADLATRLDDRLSTMWSRDRSVDLIPAWPVFTA